MVDARSLAPLDEHAVRGYIHAIPDLFRQALSHSETAPDIMARVLTRLDPDQLLRLDRRCRRALYHWLTVEELQQLRTTYNHPESWTVPAVAGFHPDGYVREWATQWLDEIENHHEIPFLVLRMNDWVGQIRKVALGAMERRLRRRTATALIANLPMLRRLERWGRSDHGPFLRRATTFLQRSDLTEARDAVLSTAGTNPALYREVLVLTTAAEPHRKLELVSLAARHFDRRIRRWALEQLRRANVGDQLEVLEFFLLDESLVHRQEAQLVARQLSPHWELGRFYREALTRGGPELRAALFGLGETGATEDVDVVLPYFDDPRTFIRRAALYAMAWLDMDGQADRMVEALDDPRRKVSNDAANNLARSAHLIPPRRARLMQLRREGSDFCRENTERVLESGQRYLKQWPHGAGDR